MNHLGLVLVSVGFVVGSLACTWNAEQIQWGLFAVGMVLGLIGVGVLRRNRQVAESGEVATQNLSTIAASLGRIVKSIEELDAAKGSVFVYDLPAKIDSTFPDDLEVFVDGRKSIAARYGVDAYAEVMTEFAAAERYLNRVWSASVDGYQTEAHHYLERARHQFKRALTTLSQLGSTST